MKKVLLAATALFVGMNLFAQEEAATALTGKNGTPILPKAGDYAIGVEASPYLEYLGNMFNNTEGNSLDLGSSTLYGRYFLEDNTALRLSLRVNNGTNSYNEYVPDDAAVYTDPLSNAKVIDTEKYKYSGIGLSVGIQKFRGYGRLRGFYGAEVSISTSNTSSEYTYGNPITALNQTPSSYWGNGSSRPLTENGGGSVSFGLGLLAGVEYYFAPKICIGGELGFGYEYTSQGQSNSTTESWGGTSVVETTDIESPGNTSSNLSTTRPATYGTLYLMFHF